MTERDLAPMNYPYGTPPDAEQRANFEKWIASRPESVRRVLRACPPWQCYRSTENPRFHYVIISVNENGTVTLGHGDDSTLPGVATFGQPPSQLIACNCGKWKPPTPEHMEETRLRINPMPTSTGAVDAELKRVLRDKRDALRKSRGRRGKA